MGAYISCVYFYYFKPACNSYIVILIQLSQVNITNQTTICMSNNCLIAINNIIISQHQPQTMIITDSTFFRSNFGQLITGYKTYGEIKQGMHLFSDKASVSDESFGIFTLKRCRDSLMSAMKNTETSGTATVQYKHTANRSIIKYLCWDADELKEISKIASLIKVQHIEQHRRQMKKKFKNHVENKLNRMYDIVTDTPYENTKSYIAYIK